MLQFEIKNCNKDNAEDIVDFLEESGALSVTMLDQQDDPILEPELGTMPLWPCVMINALFEEEISIEEAKRYLDAKYINLQYSQEILPEKNWEKACLDNFKSKQIGDKLLICPSWIIPDKSDMAVLTLDPGLAFGTGSHATTELCLFWLVNANLDNKVLLDYGCGSGILALSAIKLGAKHVYAIDIDEQALIATRNNANVNNISNQNLSVLTPDAIDKNSVDIIIANILLKTLISLKSQFLKLLNAEGQLVTSGILIEQIDELIQAFSPEFHLIITQQSEEWAMLVFQRVI